MKRIHSFPFVVWAALLLPGVTASTQASTTLNFSVDMTPAISGGVFNPATDQVSARGTFNGWGFTYLTNDPSSANPNLYTGTTLDTADPNPGTVGYKYYNSSGLGSNGGWDDGCLNGTSANRPCRLPAVSGGTVSLPAVFFGDAGPQQTSPITFRVNMAQKINVGAFVPGSGAVYVRGTMNGWGGTDLALTNDPSIHTTNSSGVVTANVYVGTYDISGGTNSGALFKYVYTGGSGDTWEDETIINSTNIVAGNRFFQLNDGVLPIVDFNDLPYSPVATNTITFQVDLTGEKLAGNFNPDAGDTVSLRGDFNNWSAGISMTNNPAAPNTNAYSTTIVVINSLNGPVNYKFTYTTGLGETYEGPQPKWSTPDGGPPYHNRVYLLKNGATTLPIIYFDDLAPGDLLPADTMVSFSVDMNGAVGTDGHTFNAGAGDKVFINGDFAGWYPWYGGVNPSDAPPQYELISSGGGIYTNSFLLPKGSVVNRNYRYGLGYDNGGGVHGAVDDDTPGSTNRTRVVRSTATGAYAMPVDKFGTPARSEPFFSPFATGDGQLQVGPLSAGTVPVKWLGRPGAHLQGSTSPAGPWTDYLNTDGAQWSSGVNTTNGLLSVTNWPSSGNRFFRLVRP
jgi:hypothetical protein